jgi:hypothetical protein
MSGTALPRGLRAIQERVSRTAVGVTLLAVVAEITLLVAYIGITDATVTNLRYLLYPFVWINVGMWAVIRARPIEASTRVRWLGALGAGAYLLVLAYFGGLLELAHIGHSHSHGGARGLSIFTALPPGWGPTVVYDHSLFTITAIPYKVVGYLALTYLVYTTLLDTVTAAVSGAVGLLTCVSCSWPVAASLITGIVGGTTAASVVYSYSIDLSTLAFVFAIGVLIWAPKIGENW